MKSTLAVWNSRQIISRCLTAWSLATVFLCSGAHALVIPIYCDGVLVGNIDVDANTIMTPDGEVGGVSGGFTSVIGDPPSLAAAAEQCDEDHFNWYQVVLDDNMPPNDADGDELEPPYEDPPPGGYGPPDTQWGDDLPWYWDEGADPPAGTDGFEDGYNLDDNTTADTLEFQDYPGGADGTMLSFATWLVSLNADGTLHDFHEGFLWEWSNSAENPGGTAVIGNILPRQLGQQLYNQLHVPEPAGIVLVVVAMAMCQMAAYRRRWAQAA